MPKNAVRIRLPRKNSETGLGSPRIWINGQEIPGVRLIDVRLATEENLPVITVELEARGLEIEHAEEAGKPE